MKRILIIGPSIERTKGGMATVIKQHLTHFENNQDFQLKHFVSHVDGTKIEKFVELLKSIISLIFIRRINLVHIHSASDISFYRKSIYVYICYVKSIPVIFHVHGADFDSFYNNSNSLQKNFIRKTFAKTKQIIALSQYWKDFFGNNQLGANTEILYNSVNPDSFLICRKDIITISNFLFLGRLEKRKGIYDLLQAIEIIVHKHKIHSLTFSLAGDGDIAEVEQIINKNGLSSYIKILGWISQPEKLIHLSSADVLILPSYDEGLPMSILEAMAAGKIILSTKVGGIPELIKEGINGFLIEPGDVNELVNKILYLNANADLVKQIPANNMQVVEKNFSSNLLNQRLISFYKTHSL